MLEAAIQKVYKRKRSGKRQKKAAKKEENAKKTEDRSNAKMCTSKELDVVEDPSTKKNKNSKVYNKEGKIQTIRIWEVC